MVIQFFATCSHRLLLGLADIVYMQYRVCLYMMKLIKAVGNISNIIEFLYNLQRSLGNFDTFTIVWDINFVLGVIEISMEFREVK